ncbi:unnamed protein product [Mytilus coruscus]|uniref:Uncharacterized protein n=1 Tax=Mytilus coruscus TaxID=42192 RepID=A0A6J8BZA4_MYTCO|nr:unnamed protein product [Mytilus coruscus]
MDTTKLVDTTFFMCTGNELIRSEFDDHYFRIIHLKGPVCATVNLSAEHEQTIVKEYELPDRLRGQIFFGKPLCIGYSFPVYVFQYRLEDEWVDVMLMILNSENEKFHFVDYHALINEWWRDTNPLKEPLECLISPDLDMFLFRCPMEASDSLGLNWFSISEMSTTGERRKVLNLKAKGEISYIFHPSHPCSVISVLHINSGHLRIGLRHLNSKNMDVVHRNQENIKAGQKTVNKTFQENLKAGQKTVHKAFHENLIAGQKTVHKTYHENLNMLKTGQKTVLKPFHENLKTGKKTVHKLFHENLKTGQKTVLKPFHENLKAGQKTVHKTIYENLKAGQKTVLKPFHENLKTGQKTVHKSFHENLKTGQKTVLKPFHENLKAGQKTNHKTYHENIKTGQKTVLKPFHENLKD